MKVYLRVFLSAPLSLDDLELLVSEAAGSCSIHIESLGPYWKTPDLDEVLVRILGVNEKELSLIADGLGEGWVESNGEYFWKIQDGGTLTIPCATWAHLEQVS